jgi:hypothetical protein
MAKKSHADIMEKLSALKPSEPTKTRGKAARKPAVKKIKVKKAADPKKPKAEAPPKSPTPAAPSKVEFSQPGFAGIGIFGDASRIYLGVYENWFQIVRNCDNMVKDCNNMFLSNLTALMNPGRWWRF